MRWLPALAVAACSFSHGAASEQPDAGAGSADAARDASGSAGGSADAAVDGPPAARTCPSGYVTLSGAPATKKYRIFNWDNSTSKDQSQAWTAAKQTCITDGTHLAFPVDAAELTALRGAITVDPTSNYFWLGLTDAAREGTWLTVLGDPAPYLPWAMGQPNNGMGPGGSGQPENCALATPANGTIYDWLCGTPYPFACECE